MPEFTVRLGKLEENRNSAVVLPWFLHWFLHCFLLKSRDELGDLSPCFFLCPLGPTTSSTQVVSEINQGSCWSRALQWGAVQKLLLKDSFLQRFFEILRN